MLLSDRKTYENQIASCTDNRAPVALPMARALLLYLLLPLQLLQLMRRHASCVSRSHRPLRLWVVHVQDISIPLAGGMCSKSFDRAL